MVRAQLLLAAALGLQACTAPNAMGPQSGAPIAQIDTIAPPTEATLADETLSTARAAWDRQPQGTEWTGFLFAALSERGERLLAANPADAQEFCPGFAELGAEARQHFYVGLVSRMAQFESGFDPATAYQESFVDSSGNPVISRGLLQLSIESARAYPGCPARSAEDLHDPRVNLNCAVAILDRLVGRDQVIGVQQNGNWRGGAAYWSVLRQTSARRAEISAYTRELPICTSR